MKGDTLTDTIEQKPGDLMGAAREAVDVLELIRATTLGEDACDVVTECDRTAARIQWAIEAVLQPTTEAVDAQNRRLAEAHCGAERLRILANHALDPKIGERHKRAADAIDVLGDDLLVLRDVAAELGRENDELRKRRSIDCPFCEGSGCVGIGHDGEANECRYCGATGQITADDVKDLRDRFDELAGDRAACDWALGMMLDAIEAGPKEKAEATETARAIYGDRPTPKQIRGATISLVADGEIFHDQAGQVITGDRVRTAESKGSV